ncbi:nitrogen regulation protein NR(II) [Aliidiomarina indica]|uniref:nitrogen regulation protein NR(II) n=1 Tax=Aliidiomarina indica TaxID=2749147 RepID=UPI0018909190|nr:nitrogen regulation protein NR(II) [Aliidiomarina indica]
MAETSPWVNEQLTDQLVMGLLILDETLAVRYANAAAEAIFSGSSRRLIGAPLDSLLRYSSFDLLLLRNVLSSQQTISDSDVSWVLHDGKAITVELTASVASFPRSQPEYNDVVLLELRQVDLIRRINQEQVQQHQLEAAQQLVRGLAHEIKNPLGGIRGAAQLLQSQLTDAQREYTQMIMDQSDRLRTLVDRLLGPNRPSPRAPENIHAILQRVLDVLSLEHSANTGIRKDYDPSLPDIQVSADQIEQVLLNIIKNAFEVVEGQEHGEVVVKTRVSHQETIYGKRYRQCALITIQDNGPGVPAELKDTLFYPLVSGRENGTGLGLSIAQSLVHQHAGKIELSSRPGCTEFTVFLPYAESDENTQEVA